MKMLRRRCLRASVRGGAPCVGTMVEIKPAAGGAKLFTCGGAAARLPASPLAACASRALTGDVGRLRWLMQCEQDCAGCASACDSSSGEGIASRLSMASCDDALLAASVPVASAWQEAWPRVLAGTRADRFAVTVPAPCGHRAAASTPPQPPRASAHRMMAMKKRRRIESES
jgi:hypothetical protein